MSGSGYLAPGGLARLAAVLFDGDWAVESLALKECEQTINELTRTQLTTTPGAGTGSPTGNDNQQDKEQ